MEWGRIWDECMRDVVGKKKKFGRDYIYDRDFQRGFKCRVKDAPDGILFGGPQMQVSKQGSEIIVTIFNDSDDPEDWETIVF